MKITECLNVEHGVFLRQLDQLEELFQRRASNEVLAAVLQTIARAVESHAAGEEQRLYPAIEAAYGPQFPPLQVMKIEHEEIDRIVEATKTADFERGLVDRFIEVLRGHIQKEVHALFPMAEDRIPAQKLEEMARNCLQEGHGCAPSTGTGKHSCGGDYCG